MCILPFSCCKSEKQRDHNLNCGHRNWTFELVSRFSLALEDRENRMALPAPPSVTVESAIGITRTELEAPGVGSG